MSTTELQEEPADVIDTLGGIAPGSRLADLRGVRLTVREAIQGSFAAIFEPAAASPGLTRSEREAAALRVAELQREDGLAALHRARGGTALAGDARGGAIRAFVDRLTLHPAAATAAQLQPLRAAGLAPADIVTLAQLVAFVNFELRVVAGLRALAVDVPGADTAAASSADADLVAGHNGVPASAPGHGAFTLDELAWSAWLPTVDPATASAEQQAALAESHAAARSSPYYLTLVRDAPVLRQRSRLFNAIMYGPGGLPRAERELATVAVSKINGCPYCASVHARLFAQLTKEPQVVEALLRDGVDTPLAPRRRAIVDLAVALSANPPRHVARGVAGLRALGLPDHEILDVVHAAAIFAWANRLMQTLGEPVAP